MDILRRKHTFIKGNITRLYNVTSTIQVSPALVKIYDVELQIIYKETNHLQAGIGLTCPEDEFDEHEQQYFEMDRLDHLKLLFKTTLGGDDPSSNSGSNISGSVILQQLNSVKLPLLELGTFTGELCNWRAFQDLFTAMVHDNVTLSEAQKLQYLKMALKCEASNIVQAIPISDGNYGKAWHLLSQRYDDEAEIIYSHLDRIFQQPALTTESLSGLRKLLDSFAKSLDLKALGQPVDKWDTILVYWLRKRLNTDSSRKWELVSEKGQIGIFATLQDFLERLAKALAASQTKKSRVTMMSTNQQNFFVNVHNTHLGNRNTTCTSTVLPTLQVQMCSPTGKPRISRALLDCGSQYSFVMEYCIQFLDLKRKRCQVAISGLYSTSLGTANGTANIIQKPLHDTGSSVLVHALIVKEVTSCLPSTKVDASNSELFNHLPMADSFFYKPGPGDLLLGADFIIRSRKLRSDLILTQETLFGWVVMGQTRKTADNQSTDIHALDCTKKEVLQSFWSLERIPEANQLTSELLCERHFPTTYYYRDMDSRYTVRLPFTRCGPYLGESRSMPYRRWYKMERVKYKTNPEWKIQLNWKSLQQGWPTRGTRATVWHGGVLSVAREDLLKIFK